MKTHLKCQVDTVLILTFSTLANKFTKLGKMHCWPQLTIWGQFMVFPS